MRKYSHIKIDPYTNRKGQEDPNRRLVETDQVKLVITKRGRKWYTRFTLDGQARQINLGTSDVREAAHQAVKLGLDAIEGVLPTAKPQRSAKRTRNRTITIGEIAEIYEKSTAPRPAKDTRAGNLRGLRLLIRTALRLDKKADVDSYPATVLKVELVREFQAVRLEGIPEGELREKAKRSANSVVDDVHSVFANYLLEEKLYPNLPDLTEFKRVKPLPAMKVEYRYEEVEKWVGIILKHLPDLRESDPAAYLLFRLSAELGFRRGEAMEARKSWICEFQGRRVIYVQPTETWLPKGRRQRKVRLPESVYQDILLLSDDSDYIVPAATQKYWTPGYTNKKGNPVKGAWRTKAVKSHENERKYGVARRLSQWFNSLGWPFEKKAHEMRRWFGAQIATQTGSIFAAQRLLGHSRAETTDQYYADLVSMPDYNIDLGIDEPQAAAK